MADIEFKLEGLDAILKKMRALPVDVRMKGARYAGRKGANLIRESAIKNAAKINDAMTAEEIAKNVAVRFSSRLFKRTGDVGFRVGILGGARPYAQTRENVRKGRAGKMYKTAGDKSNPGGDTWYWRFQELGTSKHRAQPFMRPALERNIGPATSEFTGQLNKWLDRYFKRQGVVPTDL